LFAFAFAFDGLGQIALIDGSPVNGCNGVRQMKPRSKRTKLHQQASVLVLAAGLLAVSAGGAGAQTPGTDASASQVSDVVVTATRRVEKEQDVPVSTSVITPETVNTVFAAGQDIRALGNTVPSLNIESSDGRIFPRFYIRGYGNTDYNAFASQPVSLVYDDVVQENPALKGFPLFDVEDVEVLRGPQGTLFGRNAPAGVMQVQSAKPVLGLTSGSLSVSDGTYNTANVIAMYNAPLSDQMSMRVSLQEQHRDNWVHDPINNTRLEGYDDFAGRVQLLYKPSSDFSALFNFHGRTLTGSARLFRANIIVPGTDNIVPNFNPATIYTDGRNIQQYSGIGGSARLTWDVGQVSLVSVTGVEKVLNFFTEGDIDGGYGASFEPTMGPTVSAANGTVIGIPFPAQSAGGLVNHLQLSQEFRAQSNYSGPINWLAGLYYFNETASAPYYDYDQSGYTLTDYNISRQNNDAYAVFGSVDYKPIPNLDLRGGVRFTHDHKTFDIVAALNQTFASTHALATADNVSGDFSATYTVARDFNVYGRYATGFRAPSFGGPTATIGIQVARSEINTSGEIGFKSMLADRRVKLNADVFYFDVKNQQLTAVGGVDDSTRLLNAKDTIGYGAEMEFQARITDDLTFRTAASYNFTRIQDPTLQVGICASCTVTNVVSGGLAYVNGNPLPQAPRWTVDPSFTYTRHLQGGREVFLSSDLAYRSEINFFLYGAKEFVGQPLADFGMRAGYRWNEGRYEAAVYCRNCLNQVRLVGGIDFDNLTGFINDPVIVGVELSGKF
jgi:iron complex outermembrane receptor protein